MPTHYRGTPEEVTALNAFIALLRATDSLHAHLSRHVETAGVTMGQFALLEVLLHLGPMSPSDIGAKLLRSGSNITMVLDNLERRHLVIRRRRKDDRRAIEVSLSPAGRRLITGLFPQHARLITRLFDVLAPRDQQRLASLCKTLGRSIPKPPRSRKVSRG
jgi:MarR family transcriptional regulator, 2-MHQ and catechol-resistance regulon repressor